MKFNFIINNNPNAILECEKYNQYTRFITLHNLLFRCSHAKSHAKNKQKILKKYIDTKIYG